MKVKKRSDFFFPRFSTVSPQNDWCNAVTLKHLILILGDDLQDMMFCSGFQEDSKQSGSFTSLSFYFESIIDV